MVATPEVDKRFHDAAHEWIKQHATQNAGRYRLIVEYEYDPKMFGWPVIFFPQIEEVKEESDELDDET